MGVKGQPPGRSLALKVSSSQPGVVGTLLILASERAYLCVAAAQGDSSECAKNRVL